MKKHRTLVHHIGVALRDRRVRMRLSQEAAAKRIGMHRTYYSAIERGERNLTIGTLERVSAMLGITAQVVINQAFGRSELS